MVSLVLKTSWCDKMVFRVLTVSTVSSKLFSVLPSNNVWLIYSVRAMVPMIMQVLTNGHVIDSGRSKGWWVIPVTQNPQMFCFSGDQILCTEMKPRPLCAGDCISQPEYTACQSLTSDLLTSQIWNSEKSKFLLIKNQCGAVKVICYIVKI